MRDGYYTRHQILIDTKECDVPVYDSDGNLLRLEKTTYPIYGEELRFVTYTDKDILELELTECKKWFDEVYNYKEQKYRRLQVLGLKDDDGNNVEQKLIELYNQAETYRKRIQELELLLDKYL